MTGRRSRGNRTVRQAVAFGAALLGAAGLFGLQQVAGAQDDNAPEAPREDVSGDVNELDLLETGQQLFDTSCISCHGPGGEGTENGPDITQVGELGADFMLRTGRMPLAQHGPQAPTKPPAYTDSEIEALVTYVGSFGDGPGIPDVDLASADVVEGGELYRANCQPCHNASAIGGALSYGRHAPSLTETEPTQIVEAMRFGPGEMPVFADDIFTDEQADSIAAYIRYLHEPEDPGGLPLGHTGPITEGFVAWLVGIGLAIWAVRWITRDKGPAKKPRPIEEATAELGHPREEADE